MPAAEHMLVAAATSKLQPGSHIYTPATLPCETAGAPARTRIDARVDLPLPLVPHSSTTTHRRLSLRLQAQHTHLSTTEQSSNKTPFICVMNARSAAMTWCNPSRKSLNISRGPHCRCIAVQLCTPRYRETQTCSMRTSTTKKQWQCNCKQCTPACYLQFFTGGAYLVAVLSSAC